jgi:hypothetical protein
VRFGGVGEDRAFGIAVGTNSEVYVTGGFNNAVSFGTNTLTSAGGYDIFFVKLSAGNCQMQWAQRYGSTYDDYGYAVAVDKSDGAALVTGEFQRCVNFGGGTVCSDYGSMDTFVAKYNAAGQHVWSRFFGCVSHDIGQGVAVDGSGNVVVTGTNEGAIDLGGGVLPFLSAGGRAFYLVKYDKQGTYMWGRNFGNYTTSGAYGVATDAGANVVVTGWFGTSLDLGNGITLESGNGIIAMYVINFRGSDGVVQWGKSLTTTSGYLQGRSVAVHGVSGTVWAAGYYQGTTDYGSGGANWWTSVGGSYDACVVRLRLSDGGYVGADSVGGSGTDAGWGMAVDSSGKGVAVGSTAGGPFGASALPSAGGTDGFILRLAP